MITEGAPGELAPSISESTTCPCLTSRKALSPTWPGLLPASQPGQCPAYLRSSYLSPTTRLCCPLGQSRAPRAGSQRSSLGSCILASGPTHTESHPVLLGRLCLFPPQSGSGAVWSVKGEVIQSIWGSIGRFLPPPPPSISIHIYSTVLGLAERECPHLPSHVSHRQGRTAASSRGPPVPEAESPPGSRAQAWRLPSTEKCRLLPKHLSKSLAALGRDASIDGDLPVTPRHGRESGTPWCSPFRKRVTWRPSPSDPTLTRASLHLPDLLTGCLVCPQVHDHQPGPHPRRLLPLHRAEPDGRSAAAANRGPGGL